MGWTTISLDPSCWVANTLWFGLKTTCLNKLSPTAPPALTRIVRQCVCSYASCLNSLVADSRASRIFLSVQSWSSKPEEFNLDLASPATSPTHRQQPQYASQHAQGEEDKQELEPSMAIDMRENFSLAPSPPRHKMSLEYDTLGSKSDRTLGGKKVVSGAEVSVALAS